MNVEIKIPKILFKNYDHVIQEVLDKESERIVRESRNLEFIPCPIDSEIYFKHMLKFSSKFYPEFTSNLVENLLRNFVSNEMQIYFENESKKKSRKSRK